MDVSLLIYSFTIQTIIYKLNLNDSAINGWGFFYMCMLRKKDLLNSALL